MTLDFWLEVLLAIMAFSLMICFVRLYLGPNPPNRTVAFDTITSHAIGIFALLAMRSKAAALLDAAIVTAVLGFVGTVMLARYIEQSNLQDWESDEE
ncbi:monovalent cation/H+ antiporter complex subunit F [Caldilinea sp.]|jgi:multisubunit Na+/H+ antiporter MnhF subunit|uniref:monovalent cation/H+ antiporter complex subunit F n=1 Tax=Caldilinea sp. TaxID=2293560 RepID=UPI0021DEDBD1|nr:monovalent cation/H+ antiporter complex subunit F [Caldilinea sp.]GIV68178.1 MAG: cation transporter [Caldilinea sp.]